MRKFGRVQAAMVPAHPHFDGDRNRHRLDCCLNQAGGERQIAHQRRAGIAVDDLLHRTAHIDVDNRRPAIFIELGRFAHFIGSAPCKLHRHRLFAGVPLAFL